MVEFDQSDQTAEVGTLAPGGIDTLGLPGFSVVSALSCDGVVRAFDCKNTTTGDLVRVLVLEPQAAADDVRRTRAVRDNRLLMGLRHNANLGRVLDVKETGAGVWIVCEGFGQQSLAEQLSPTTALHPLDALAAVGDAARGLASAHGIGLIHRDITPARLWRAADGKLKLTGFGLHPRHVLRERNDDQKSIDSSPAVTAPELTRGAAPDIRTDLYALGATLYWLMVGRPMFVGTDAEVLAAQERKPVPSIASQVPGAGLVVVDLLYRLLNKDPLRRPSNAQEVVAAIDAARARLDRDSHAPTSILPSVSALPPPPAALASPPRTASPFDAAEVGDPYQSAPTGVMGSLKQMSVVEILQTLDIGKKSARVDIHPQYGDKGTLHVHAGHIVHASTPSLVGEQAVFDLVKRKEGMFRIHYEEEACERNIDRPTQFVLLEAMRQIDEGVAASTQGAPHGGAPPAQSEPPPLPRSKSSPPILASALNELRDFAHDGINALPPLPPPPPPFVRPALQAQALGKAPLHARPLIEKLPSADPFAADSNPLVTTLPLHALDASGPRRAAVAASAMGGDRTDEGPPIDDGNVTPARGKGDGTRTLDDWLMVLKQQAVPVREQLARLHPRLGALPLWQLLTLVLTAFTCVVVLVQALWAAPESALSRADAAAFALMKPHQAASTLSAIPIAERTARERLMLGHALLSIGEPAAAYLEYQAAMSHGVLDATLLRALLSRLDSEPASDAIDLLVLWPDAEVTAELVDVASGADSTAREHAVAILTERGDMGALDLEASARLTLRDGRSCAERRGALRVLRLIGSTESTRATIEDVGRRDDGCLQAELPTSYATVARRLSDQLRKR